MKKQQHWSFLILCLSFIPWLAISGCSDLYGPYDNLFDFDSSFPTVAGLSCGGEYSAMLGDDSVLWVTGANGYGQLGDGTTTDRQSPVRVMSGVSSVSAGSFHTMILKTDGSLWATGCNLDGRLGEGTTTNPFNSRAGDDRCRLGVGRLLAYNDRENRWQPLGYRLQ